MNRFTFVVSLKNAAFTTRWEEALTAINLIFEPMYKQVGMFLCIIVFQAQAKNKTVHLLCHM